MKKLAFLLTLISFIGMFSLAGAAQVSIDGTGLSDVQKAEIATQIEKLKLANEISKASTTVETKEVAVKASIDIGDNITRLIEKLAANIGKKAPEIFPWYVKQQVLEGIIQLCSTALLLVISLGMILYNHNKADWDGFNSNSAGTIVGYIALVIFIIAACSLGGAITKILNPNYHALSVMTQDMSKLLGNIR